MASAAEALAGAKWRSSGITDELAGKLGYRGLTSSETIGLHHKFHPVSALYIPYHDFSGSPTGFYRLRYLEPPPGFLGQVARPQRYTQAPGTLCEVYLPPLVKWASIAADPSVAIYITEGELKAASACSLGFPTIGLGGVDSWRATKRGIDFLPQLKEIQWKQREVFIVFDSDASLNPNVVSAQRRLASELVARGAQPKIVSLPGGEGGTKVGLDDFLLANGPKEFEKILNDALPHAEGEALWGLNEEVIYVRDPGLVVEKSTGQRIAVKNFVQHTYANRRVLEQRVGPGGKVVVKEVSLAEKWIKWEHRFEAQKIVYEPGEDKLYRGSWNAWDGWGAEEKEGSVHLWDILLGYIFKDEPEARKWFEQWCAYPIQHPGEKMYSAVMIWSARHGTGKTLLAYLLKSVYGKNAVEIGSDALRGSFNAWAEYKQFVVGDEITAGDARLDKDKLKWLITRAEIPVNQKYVPEYTIRDCINYLFTSNNPDAMFVESFDRRYFIAEITGDPLPEQFYDQCDKWLHSGEAAANLLYHLRRVDLTGFNPHAPALVTNAKKQMILDGKSELGLFVHELKEDPETRLRPLGEEVAKTCELFTAGSLLRALDPSGDKKITPTGLAKELKRAGYRPLNGGVPIRTKYGLVRLYAIRNQDKWLPLSPRKLADHYEKHFVDNQRF